MNYKNLSMYSVLLNRRRHAAAELLTGFTNYANV